MCRIVAAVCLAAIVSLSSASVIVQVNEIEEEKKLVLAFVVHRHGDRNPDEDELSLSNEQSKILSLIQIDGLEGLTNVGKRRAYQIGKFIRQRYGANGLNLISNLYLRDEIFVRSTDKERTKMTALVAMAAVYPPELEQQWDDGVGKAWQPVPYSTVPLSMDYLRFYVNCKSFITLMEKAKEESISQEFLPYQDLLEKLQQETGKNFTEDPLRFEMLFDLFNSQKSMGLDLPEWAKPILPRLNDAALQAYKLYMRTEEMKRIGGGVLLDHFTAAASAIASGSPVSRPLKVFSAHDFNIGALMAVTSVAKDVTIPEYGSVFMLELYRDGSGNFTVEPVYLSQAGSATAQKLTFTGCNSPCSLTKFKALTKEYLLPEQKYYEICGISTKS